MVQKQCFRDAVLNSCKARKKTFNVDGGGGKSERGEQSKDSNLIPRDRDVMLLFVAAELP